MILSYSQAQAKARDWFAEQERAGDGAPYTVSQALDDYMAWFREHKKSVRDTELAIEAHIRPALGQTDVGRLTTLAIRQWHRRLAETPARLRTRLGRNQKYREARADSEGRRARQATANRVLTVLKAALNHAYREGKAASDDAWRRVKPFAKVDAARLRYLTKGECRRLLNACRPDFRRLVQAALLAGCRYGELTRATAGDFIADAGALHVRESKSGKPRHVPLDGDAREFFTAMTAGRAATDTLFLRDDGKSWGKSYQIRPLLEACRAARIEPAVGFHSLRHTWASHRVMAVLRRWSWLRCWATAIPAWSRSTMGTLPRPTCAR